MLAAHSPNAEGQWHGLTEHLDKVAALAAEFSSQWGDPLWAGLAGAWHDLGKARPGFQRRLAQDADAHIESRRPGAEATHSAAGAVHAAVEFAKSLDASSAAPLARVLQYLIAGHHAGLADWQPDGHGQAGLATRLANPAAQTEYLEAIAALGVAGEAPLPAPGAPALVAAARVLLGPREPLARSLALRMLFSGMRSMNPVLEPMAVT